MTSKEEMTEPNQFNLISDDTMISCSSGDDQNKNCWSESRTCADVKQNNSSSIPAKTIHPLQANMLYFADALKAQSDLIQQCKEKIILLEDKNVRNMKIIEQYRKENKQRKTISTVDESTDPEELFIKVQILQNNAIEWEMNKDVDGLNRQIRSCRDLFNSFLKLLNELNAKNLKVQRPLDAMKVIDQLEINLHDYKTKIKAEMGRNESTYIQ